MAERAEQAKCSKYALLQTKYTFVPVGIQTSGAFGPSALSFTNDLGRWLKLHTFESNSYQYLMQRLSVAVQRANLLAVLGTLVVVMVTIVLCFKVVIGPNYYIFVFVLFLLYLFFCLMSCFIILILPVSCSVPFFVCTLSLFMIII